VGPILWKWNPHIVVEHTMILPNKRVSARESAQKRVLIALLKKKEWKCIKSNPFMKSYKVKPL